MRNRNDYLFCTHDLRQQIETLREKLNASVLNLSPNQLSVENQQQVEAHYVQANTITPISVFVEQTVLEDPREVETRVDGHFGSFLRKDLLFRFLIPFEGTAWLFQCQPSTYSSAPMGRVEGQSLVFTILQSNQDQSAIRQGYDQFVASVTKYLGWQREQVDHWNTHLPSIVKQLVQSRHDKFVADRQLVDGLGFTVVRQGEAPRAAIVPIQRKQVITPLPVSRPGAVLPPDPVMDAKVYEEILDTLDTMSVVMERSPTTFEKVEEEYLRTHFLVSLNANFKGMASGETFHAAGKTDILIKHQDRVLFIAECKFWKGAQSLTDAISQLLSYTTWRETKCAILLFNRNKDFSAVLQQVPGVFAVHPNFVRQVDYAKPTGYRCILRSPNDSQRHLTVTLLAFNIPSENPKA